MRKTSAWAICSLVIGLSAVWQMQARDQKDLYPSMAPLNQYLMEREAEVALVRSAAPEVISRDADIMVLGRQGYETVAKGRNGFVCLVLRSWTAGIDDVEFWNPKTRAPICLNPAAVRSYLPSVIKRTELALAGRSRDEIAASVRAAYDKKELPMQEPGAMCYMMSKQGHVNDHDGNWHPHVMFFVPLTEAAAWGADAPGSPILASKDPLDRLTVFLIPVGKWSDGTDAPVDAR